MAIIDSYKQAFEKTHIATILMTFAVASSMACSGSGAGSPNCEQAMAHSYAMGCAITHNESQLTESDAVSMCNQNMTSVDNGACSCGAQFGAVLNCLASEGQDGCDACSTQLTAWDACLTSNCAGEVSGGSSGGTTTSGSSNGSASADAGASPESGPTPGAWAGQNAGFYVAMDGTTITPSGSPYSIYGVPCSVVFKTSAGSVTCVTSDIAITSGTIEFSCGTTTSCMGQTFNAPLSSGGGLSIGGNAEFAGSFSSSTSASGTAGYGAASISSTATWSASFGGQLSFTLPSQGTGTDAGTDGGSSGASDSGTGTGVATASDAATSATGDAVAALSRGVDAGSETSPTSGGETSPDASNAGEDAGVVLSRVVDAGPETSSPGDETATDGSTATGDAGTASSRGVDAGPEAASTSGGETAADGSTNATEDVEVAPSADNDAEVSG